MRCLNNTKISADYWYSETNRVFTVEIARDVVVLALSGKLIEVLCPESRFRDTIRPTVGK